MGETVNLRQWKKRRERADAETTAARNRAAYGVPKPVKQQIEAEAAKAAALLDGKKLDPKSGA